MTKASVTILASIRRVFGFGLALLLIPNLCTSQENNIPDWGKTAIIASTVPVSIGIIHVLSMNRNYGIRESSPHWRTRACDAQNFDIAGNALYCYVLTRNLRYEYQYAGFSPFAASALAGANVGLMHAYLKYRESLYWGAERHDFYGAWAGISFAILQGAFPGLERVQYKWLWNSSGTKKFDGPFLENYRAQRFFVAVRLGDYLFDQKFLQGFGLTFGGGLQGDGHVRNYFGLDYDIRALLPNFLGESINYVHIPLPAVYYENGLRVGLAL